jgi:hypothetical protein
MFQYHRLGDHRTHTAGPDKQDHRALAELFEADSIVQTARRARASITQASDQEAAYKQALPILLQD